MQEIFVADLLDVAFGAERQFGVNALGALIDDRPELSVIGAAVDIAFDEVLVDFRSNVLEKVAWVPEHRAPSTEHRAVAQHRVSTLHQVVDGDRE